MQTLNSTEDRTISLILNHVLEDIGVTKDMVIRRRRTFLEEDAVFNLSCLLLGLKTTSFMFGSQSEGTTTLGMGSDLDTLTYMNNWPVILSIDDWTAGKDNLLLLRDHHTPPQHCFLQRLCQNSREPMKIQSLNNDDNHDFDNNGRVLIKNTYVSSSAQRLSKRSGKRYIAHGPCVSHSVNVDYVFCFHCKKVPSVCRSWSSRQRLRHWPPENVKEAAMNSGIFLLPLGHPESDQAPVEWRLSTSAAERCLMFALSTCQIKVYILLKLIRKTFIQKVYGERLSTYHLKTALLYTVENSPPGIWREDNILQCAIYCLMTLARWLHQNYLPHYTIEGVNLLIGKLEKRELPRLGNIIWNMINTKLQCVLVIRIDGFGDKLWKLIHREWLCSHQFTSRGKVECASHQFTSRGKVECASHQFTSRDKVECASHQFTSKGKVECASHQFTSRGKVECAIMAELAEHYFGYINHFFNEYLVKANKASFDNVYDAVRINLSRLSNGLLSSDQIKRDATKLIIRYLSSVIATMQASLWIRKGFPAMALCAPNIRDLFKEASRFDIASCKLKLASVYYCMREYRKVDVILTSVVNSFQPFILSACECRKGIMKKPTKAFCRRALELTNQDTLKYSVALCVKFLRHEKECVPKHLIYEMFRATGEDDLKARDPWDDTWMDMAVVDSLPFAYYLQYLTYRELGMEEARIDAVEKLTDYVEKYNGYGHIETVCNLVGHCFELEGLFDQALEWYLESLQAMPRNNAAIWHVIVMLYGFFRRG